MKSRLRIWLAAEWHMLKAYGVELLVAFLLIGAIVAMTRAPQPVGEAASEVDENMAAAAYYNNP